MNDVWIMMWDTMLFSVYLSGNNIDIKSHTIFIRMCLYEQNSSVSTTDFTHKKLKKDKNEMK